LYREIIWIAIGATWQKIIWLDDIFGKCVLLRGLETIIRSDVWRKCGGIILRISIYLGFS
jgi:hypothetical protein